MIHVPNEPVVMGHPRSRYEPPQKFFDPPQKSLWSIPEVVMIHSKRFIMTLAHNDFRVAYIDFRVAHIDFRVAHIDFVVVHNDPGS